MNCLYSLVLTYLYLLKDRRYSQNFASSSYKTNIFLVAVGLYSNSVITDILGCASCTTLFSPHFEVITDAGRHGNYFYLEPFGVQSSYFFSLRYDHVDNCFDEL